MNTEVANWSDIQRRAAQPPTILSRWRDQRRGLTNATYSEQVMESFGINPSASGASVTPASSMRVSAVFACVQRIAGGISILPVHHYKRTPTSRQRVDDSQLWWYLNEQPTPRYTSASMWEYMVMCMLLRGDGYCFVGRDAFGYVRELIPLQHGSVMVEREQTATTDRLKYYVRDGARVYGVDQDDMLHFPGFGFDGLKGMSVIRYAAQNAAGTAMAMDEYSGRFFAGGAHPSMVLQAEGTMTKEAIQNLQAAFVSKYSGAENAHRLPLVLTEGLKASNVSLSAQDAQLLEARKFQVIDIARAFGVPPHMIGETSASTSWGSGIEEMNRAFVTYTLQPHLVRIEQELNRKLFRTSANFFEFDRESLLEGNTKAQSEYFRAALGGPGSGMGWMTVNEVRKLKNLPPLEGKANEIFDPTPVAPEPPEAEEQEDSEDSEEPSAADQALTSMAAAFGILAAREPAPNIINNNPAPIDIKAGDVHVSLPENFVQNHVSPAQVNVTTGETIVNAELHMPKVGAKTIVATRDAQGKLVATVQDTDSA